VKIATWNVNSLRVRLEHVRAWLQERRPDVLALQETKTKDEDFPAQAFEPLGYHVAFSGQAAYNGVALLSRKPLSDIRTELDGLADPERRVLAATCGDLRIVNLYVPNGQYVGSDKYRYKLEWLDALRGQLVRELERHADCAVLGDFNIAPEDRDVHDPAAWQGKVLCSDAERAALTKILELGFVDTFRLFSQPDKSYSWWDYRGGAFRRNRGLRIDLILAAPALSSRCTRCTIDTQPRGWERPSDHAPVTSEFEFS
jgi:exodeoxyribonuclease-3